MTALAFELAPALEASQPPEARGLARDHVRLMVASRASGEIVHARFDELADHLRPGDLIVVNASATLPAAVPAHTSAGTPIEVRFATRAPATDAEPDADTNTDADAPIYVIELRGSGGEEALGSGRAGELIELNGGGRLELVARYADSARLWLAQLCAVADLRSYLARHGHPIRYRYVPERWPLRAYQTAYATTPGSAEMPSAGRPFTPELITRLVAHGILIAPLLLHTGVSSPESHEPPCPEPYELPTATARLVNAVREWGGRVIAVGTTVVRTLETTADEHGAVHPGAGWTDLVISADDELSVADGMLTGWHEPFASHLQMLEAVAGQQLVERSYASALERGYLWHEFGDSHLILP